MTENSERSKKKYSGTKDDSEYKPHILTPEEYEEMIKKADEIERGFDDGTEILE